MKLEAHIQSRLDVANEDLIKYLAKQELSEVHKHNAKLKKNITSRASINVMSQSSGYVPHKNSISRLILDGGRVKSDKKRSRKKNNPWEKGFGL